MIAAVDVEPRDGYRIWLRYSDGVAGEVDLSTMAGRGVFKVWLDRAFLEGVHVSGHGSIAWSDDIELCEDALYMALTGKSAEELFPALKKRAVDARSGARAAGPSASPPAPAEPTPQPSPRSGAAPLE